MTIEVYANYDAEVITEKEFLAKVEELAEKYNEDTAEFETFLDDNYTVIELWNMTEKGRIDIINAFQKKNIERATYEIEGEWIETTLEV